MDVRELGQLSPDQEFQHWWIRTRFLHLEKALAGLARQQQPEGPLQILEMGCGSAQNLRYLRQKSQLTHRINSLTGVDPHFEPARWSTPWLGSTDRILRTPEPGWEERYDLLIAMDVLEHLADDRAALSEWGQWLRPGAWIFVTVPAFASLWSAHDEKLGHYRRYTRRSLEELARRAGLERGHTCYIFSHAFPAVYLLRRLLRVGSASGQGTDLRPTPTLLNSALILLGRLEASLGGNPWFGTSVVGLFQKPEKKEAADAT